MQNKMLSCFFKLSNDIFVKRTVKMKTPLNVFSNLHLHNQRALVTLLTGVCDEKPLTRRPLTLRCTM